MLVTQVGCMDDRKGIVIRFDVQKRKIMEDCALLMRTQSDNNPEVRVDSVRKRVPEDE